MVNDDFDESADSGSEASEDYENLENTNEGKEVKYKKKEVFTRDNPEGQPQFVARARVPKGKQVLGKIIQRYGGAKMLVKCSDSRDRNCRIPGRMKRKLWIREGHIVLVEPWEFEGDTRGDVIFKYTPAEIEWLKRSGILKAEVLEL
jgi:translation initiation factor 1A